MLIISQILYYIPYGTHPELGIILGIAASLANRRIVTKNNAQIETLQNCQYFLNTPQSKNFKLIKH